MSEPRFTSPDHDRVPLRIGGFLAFYLLVLGYLIVHGLGLTIAAIIINANPSLAGVSEPLPWAYIAFYVVTNVILAGYSLLVMRLIIGKRRSAVAHNAIWAILTVVFLVIWHFLGMKSTLGVLIDSLPGLVGTLYLLRSHRVRQTLIRP